MTVKRGFIIVFFLLFALSLIPDSFAQQCYVDIPNGIVCQGSLDPSQLSIFSGTTYQTSCSNLPQYCEVVCQVCSTSGAPAGPFQNKFNPRVLTCDKINSIWTTVKIFSTTEVSTQAQCDSASTITVQTATVSGKIRNSAGVVDQADVWCLGKTTKSSSTGDYSLTGCFPGNQIIYAQKSTQSGQSAVIPLSAGGSISGVDVTISSAPTATLTVSVKNQAGNLISANVTVGNTKTEQGTTTPLQFTNIPYGTVQITAEKSGFKTEITSFSFSATTTSATITLQPVTTAKITGVVFDGNPGITTGTKVQGATVSVVNTITNAVIASVTSDSDGKYEFSNIPLGAYFLQATKTGTGSASKIITLTGNIVSPEADLTLVPSVLAQTINLELTVVNKTNGRPVSKALIGTPFGVYTDSLTGKASLPLSSGQPYYLKIDHPDYKPYLSPEITGGLTSFTAQLTPYATVVVTGKILNGSDPSKRPIQGALVSFPNANSVTTDGSGNFQLIVKVITNSPLPLYVSDPRFIATTKQIQVPEQASYSVGNIELLERTCTNERVTLLDPLQVTDKLKLEWFFECTPDSYKITRNDITINTSNNPSISNYLDGPLQGSSQYCYVVEATYHKGGIAGDVVVKSDKKCKTTTNEDCFQGDRTLCNGNTLVECKNGAVKESTCDTDKLCIEKTDKVAQCVPAVKCELCNRPFDIFHNTASQYGSLFGGIGSNLSLFDFKATRDNVFDCAAIAEACYQDYSKTIVDKFYSCDNIHSCYDYASQDTCEGTQHNKCTPNEDCQWVPSSYSELGVGVCRPVDAAKQDCSKFSTSQLNAKEISNTVFASDTCRLYGASCYYSTIQNKCLGKDQISCYDYNDKADCVGSTNPQDVQVNVSWHIDPPLPNGHLYVKFGGNNNILKPSNDYFKIGLCSFSNDKCVKDADSNQNRTRYPLSIGTGTLKFEENTDPLVSSGYDCKPDDVDCSTDKNPPLTSINLLDGASVNLAQITYDVVDNSVVSNPSNANKIKTWYLVRNSSLLSAGNIYPTTQASGQKINLLGEGPKTIFYFSEDKAHNLEQIKRLDFFLDKTAPEIVFSYVIIPNLNSNTVTFIPTLTLPSVKSNGDQNDNSAYCSVTNLVKIDGGEISLNNFKTQSNIDLEAKTQWSETYQNIPTQSGQQSGIRTKYSWECYDAAGNKASGSREIYLDADMTIYDPLPNLAVKSGTVEISVKTQSLFPGECRYSESPINTNAKYQAAQVLSSQQLPNGDYIHSASITITNAANKYYYVACSLTGIQGIVQGSGSDNIKVTIDDQKPRTDIFDQKGNLLTGALWFNGPSITLKCNDTEQRVPGFPTEIGCGNVYSCLDENNQPCTPQQGSDSVIPPLTVTTNLRYYSVDKLGNAENNAQPIIKQVNFDDVPPTIVIDDSLLGTIETNQQEFLVTGKIVNHGRDSSGNECIRGTGCTVSPFKDRGTYYVLLNGSGQVRNDTISLFDLNAEEIPVALSLILNQNQQNDVVITTEDQAGNAIDSNSVTIIQDDLGPDLNGTEGNPVIIERTAPGYSTTYLNIEYGNDFPIRIKNIADRYPISIFKDRVSSVWVKDMFGAKYDLEKTVNGWEGVIHTKSWLPSKSFTTFITIFANDTLGNVAERRIDENNGFVIEDTTPPTASITLENKYGDEINKLVKGENYIILSASESLDNASLFFRVGNNKYNVTFIARDFEALNWVGIVNIPEGMTGNAVADGVLYDSNGNPSVAGPSSFTHTSLTIDSRSLPAPRPKNYDYDSKNDRYNITTATLLYDNILLALSSPVPYQFSVNGKIETYDPNSGFNLNKGVNDVSIRVEDQDRVYESFQQKVFVDANVPAQSPSADVQPPQITTQSITYSGLSKINGNLVSRNNSIHITGTYAGDTTNVYVLGDDGKQYAATLNTDGTFSVDVDLLGRTFEEKANNLILIFEDASGNKAQQAISVIKDLRPPQLISLLFRP